MLRLFFYLTVIVVFSCTSAQNNTCPPNGSIYSSTTQKCYKVLKSTPDWYAAELQCQSIGVNGHLTSIDSAFENRYMIGIGHLFVILGLIKNWAFILKLFKVDRKA